MRKSMAWSIEHGYMCGFGIHHGLAGWLHAPSLRRSEWPLHKHRHRQRLVCCYPPPRHRRPAAQRPPASGAAPAVAVDGGLGQTTVRLPAGGTHHISGLASPADRPGDSCRPPPILQSKPHLHVRAHGLAHARQVQRPLRRRPLHDRRHTSSSSSRSGPWPGSRCPGCCGCRRGVVAVFSCCWHAWRQSDWGQAGADCTQGRSAS